MGQVTETKFVILWENEIRAAAKSLEAIRTLMKNPETPEETMRDAVQAMYQACAAALYGAEAPDACIVLSSVPQTLMAKIVEVGK